MFKDYYSILKISYPASNDIVKKAYITIINCLGSESVNVSNPNYQIRVDTEEAFRVLGASYSLREAYDEEYQKAKEKGMDVYEIKDDWLLSGIEREHNFVVNTILNPKHKPSKPKNNWTNNTFGCLFKPYLIFLCLIALLYVSKCSEEKTRESHMRSMSSTSLDAKKSAEEGLKSFVMQKNLNLPQDINENITTQAVLLNDDAIVYVYNVDDTFFSEFKDYAFSREIQLKNLQTVNQKTKPLTDLLIETYRGIYYRYICRESGEINEFKITYNDLLELQ